MVRRQSTRGADTVAIAAESKVDEVQEASQAFLTGRRSTRHLLQFSQQLLLRLSRNVCVRACVKTYDDRNGKKSWKES